MTAGSLVRSVLRGRARDTALASGLVVVHLLCELGVPLTVGLVVDRAVVPRDGEALLRWLGLLALLFAALAAAGYAGYQRVAITAERAAADVRRRLVARILSDDPGSLPAEGELLSLAGSDARRLGSAVEVVAATSAAVVTLAAGAVLLLLTSVQLGLLVLLGVPAVLLLAQLLAGPLERRSTTEQAAVAAATTVATDLVRGLRVLKGLSAEQVATDRYRLVSQAARHGRVRAAALHSLGSGLQLAANAVLLAAVALLGVRLVSRGELSVGELVTAVGVAQFLTGPVQRLAWAVAQAAVVRASSGRLVDLLAAPVAGSAAPAGADTVAGALSVEADPAGPLPGGLHLPAGSWTGVVAAPTVMQQLVDLLTRRDGCDRLRLDDRPAPGIDLTTWRRAVHVAEHDAVLLAGPLRGDLHPDGEPDPAVLAATAADEVLLALPEGLDTVQHPGGRTLSGGQRQRLLLARAVLTDPAVLVLHDPTTAVDAVTEAAIAQGLRRVRTGTTLLLTSSPALLAACDRVLHLAGPQLLQTGSHDQLLHHDSYRAAVLG